MLFKSHLHTLVRQTYALFIYKVYHKVYFKNCASFARLFFTARVSLSQCGLRTILRCKLIFS